MKASYCIKDFLCSETKNILNDITEDFYKSHNTQENAQNRAWKVEIDHLKTILKDFSEGRIIFEYNMPVLKSTIDVVLLYHGKIYVIEYKTGESAIYSDEHISQVNKYAMRLKYFHSRSNHLPIVPILVVMNGVSRLLEYQYDPEDQIFGCIKCNANNLREAILNVDKIYPNQNDPNFEEEWERGIFKASPTIITAARNVWKKNNVLGFQMPWSNKDSRLSAEDYINKIIEKTKRERGKAICFVTGVPGAGKTLVGLNISVMQQENGASMLSGNGPLVEVLTSALKRDLKANKNNLNKDKNEVSIETIIRNAYGYKKEIFDRRLDYHVGKGTVSLKENADKGSQHIIIFDEAQRAWNKEKLINPGQTGRKDWQEAQFPFSEAGLLLWDMNQRDWGVFICLVGGGQEINTGEAGICEWLHALKSFPEHFGDWKIYMAENLQGSEYNRNIHNGETLASYCEFFRKENRIFIDSSLHLTECQRSLRSTHVSDFINKFLECKKYEAKDCYDQFKNTYKIRLTRDIEKAREYLRKKGVRLEGISDDEIRVGILMSSKGARIRPLGYEIKKVSEYLNKVANWFLDSSDSINSSNYLEVALNEFFVQGLELDAAAIIWDADFRYDPKTNSWKFFEFNGKRWSKIDREDSIHAIKRFYMKNAYRVLLTRARAGMVIVVPQGSGYDQNGSLIDGTRRPDYYDDTYNYLLEILGQESLLI